MRSLGLFAAMAGEVPNANRVTEFSSRLLHLEAWLLRASLCFLRLLYNLLGAFEKQWQQSTKGNCDFRKTPSHVLGKDEGFSCESSLST